MFVSIDILGPKEKIWSFAQIWSKYLVDPCKLFLTFAIVDNTRKTCPKSFHHRKDCHFFSKLSVFNSLLDPRNSYLPHWLSNYFVDLINCSLIFFDTGWYEEKQAKIFCLRCQKDALIHPTRIVKIPCEPLLNGPWGLSCSIIRGGIDKNLSITGKIAFSSKLSVFNSLCDHEKLLF